MQVRGAASAPTGARGVVALPRARATRPGAHPARRRHRPAPDARARGTPRPRPQRPRHRPPRRLGRLCSTPQDSAVPGGEVIALVAGSGTGKTTAAARLTSPDAGSASFGYVTDETVAVLGDGRVPPFPKPLAVIDDPGCPATKTHHGPDRLGLRHCPDDLRLHAVVLLRRDPSLRHDPVLAPLPTLAAVHELVGHTSALLRLAQPCSAWPRSSPAAPGCFTVTYAESGDLALPLRGAVAARADRRTGSPTGSRSPARGPIEAAQFAARQPGGTSRRRRRHTGRVRGRRSSSATPRCVSGRWP